MCWHVLTRFPQAREQRIGVEAGIKTPCGRARPRKEGFRSFCDSKIEMKSQRATFRSRYAYLSSAERHRRSDSGAAVRLIRAENWVLLWVVGWAELLAVLWTAIVAQAA